MRHVTLLALVLNTALMPMAEAKSEVYKCQEQELYIRDTKTGYSIGLSNKPVKESTPFYLVNGSKVDQESAVAYAKQNMKPVEKPKR